MTSPAPKPAPKKRHVSRAPKPLPEYISVTLILERASGDVQIEEENSTPAETWYMVTEALEKVNERRSVFFRDD